MTTSQPQAVVFTDLDGTLLGHHDYRVDGAYPGLARCAELGIPVVPTTSKTAAETQALMQRLALRWGCIVENGSAAILPERSPWRSAVSDAGSLRFGVGREQIQATLQSLRERTGARFQAFHEMTIARIAELTGLAPEDAKQASMREYTEPLYWEDSDQALERFVATAQASGLQCLRGGRFVHLLGQTDKGHAARALLQQVGLAETPMIALGDANNDEALIRAADIGVWVRSPRASAPAVTARSQTIHTHALAPEGWTEGVLAALNICIGNTGAAVKALAQGTEQL